MTKPAVYYEARLHTLENNGKDNTAICKKLRRQARKAKLAEEVKKQE